MPDEPSVTGCSAGQARWRLTDVVGLRQALGLLLLSDGSVLLVDNARVDRISRDGILTPLCEVSVGDHGSVAGLVNGDLVIAYPRSVAAYTLPGRATARGDGRGHAGGGPAQGWAVRAAP